MFGWSSSFLLIFFIFNPTVVGGYKDKTEDIEKKGSQKQKTIDNGCISKECILISVACFSSTMCTFLRCNNKSKTGIVEEDKKNGRQTNIVKKGQKKTHSPIFLIVSALLYNCLRKSRHQTCYFTICMCHVNFILPLY